MMNNEDKKIIHLFVTNMRKTKREELKPLRWLVPLCIGLTIMVIVLFMLNILSKHYINAIANIITEGMMIFSLTMLIKILKNLK